jgi:hypothetical protein
MAAPWSEIARLPHGVNIHAPTPAAAEVGRVLAATPSQR